MDVKIMMMDFLNIWWTKVKTILKNCENIQSIEAEGSTEGDPLDTGTMEAQMQRIRHSLDKTTPSSSQEDAVLDRLHALDALLETSLNENEEDALDARATHIKDYIGVPEAYQALRQARWPTGIHCTGCHSDNIRRLPQLPSDSEHNHRYRCLDCRLEFNDDDGIVGGDEGGASSLSIWMQCWYLMGWTDSLSYIAHSLGLDLKHVEWMVQRLRDILGHATTPQLNLSLEADAAQNDAFSERLKAALLAHEASSADPTGVPKNTEETRRLLNLRRNLNASTDPTVPVSSAPKRKL